jgi:hypothetical protein
MDHRPNIRCWDKEFVLLAILIAGGATLIAPGVTNAQPDPPRATVNPLFAQTAPPKQKSLAWIPVSEAVAMVITLLMVIGLGVWFRVRQGRAKAIPEEEPILNQAIEDKDEPILDTAIEEEEPPPPITFRCPACRRGLKARADLAGKKVKCRQCAKAVNVPGKPEAKNGHIAP